MHSCAERMSPSMRPNRRKHPIYKAAPVRVSAGSTLVPVPNSKKSISACFPGRNRCTTLFGRNFTSSTNHVSHVLDTRNSEAPICFFKLNSSISKRFLRLQHTPSPGSPTAFGPPFDDNDADIILRSSDQVEFLVYKVILSKASPVFKTMFSLPQPATDTTQNSRPIVDLAENSKVLAAVLSAIYPHTSVAADPLSLDDLITILDTARKYDMATALRRLIDSTRAETLRSSPVEAFCAAYSRELREAAQIAARASLKNRLTFEGIGDKLQYINGPAIHRLWKFHRACCAAAVEAIPDNTFTWIPPAVTTEWGGRYSNCGCHKVTVSFGFEPKKIFLDVTISWRGYLDRARNALREHPCSEAVTNQALLRPSFEEQMCDKCRQRLCGQSEFSRYLGEEVERIVSEVREALASFSDILSNF